MELNVDQMVCKLSCPEELSEITYFKQFNIYDNILLNDIRGCIESIETTMPRVDIYFSEIINTKKGISLDGQYLTGKKLTVMGNIFLDLIINYCNNSKKKLGTRFMVTKICLPFSEFIIIPDNLCDIEEINIKYLIEDVTAINLCDKKVLVSVTMLIQYLD